MHDLQLIIEELQRGENKERNFRLLYGNFYSKLFKFFASHGLSSTEDIRDLIQNTFFKVYKNIDQLKNGRKFASWLFTIARNNLKDWLRERKEVCSENKNENKNLAETLESDVLEPIIRQENYQLVMKAIQVLPKRMRECILMRAEGYSYEEIALALRISVETVKSQLYQSRKKLKTLLGDQYYEIDF